MAKTLYLGAGYGGFTHRGTNSNKLDGAASGWRAHYLRETRDAGAATYTANTVAGTTSGVEITDAAAGTPIEWLSDPLSADFTISGVITCNVWALESSMNANVAINFIVYKYAAADETLTEIVRSARVTELGTSSAAANFTATPGAGVNCLRGDRVIVRVYGDDSSTMASGFTFSAVVGAASAGVSGDSYVTFTETLTFESDPAGTVLYPQSITEGLTGGISDLLKCDDLLAANSLDRGASYATWSSTDLARDQDEATSASCSITSAGTDYLRSQNAAAKVPDGATITGVKVWIRAKCDVNPPDIAAQLLDVSGARVGSIHSWGPLTTSYAWWSSGDQGDLWGNAFTPAWVNDPDFGFVVYFTTGAGNCIVNVSDVYYEISYSLTGSNIMALRLGTARGSAGQISTTDTEAGWTAGAQATLGSVDSPSLEWYTNPLQALTLSGKVRCNIRVAAGANASCRVELARVEFNGSSPTVWGVGRAQNSSGSVLGASEAAYTVDIGGAPMAVGDNQRLRFRLYTDDSILPMGVGSNVNFWYSGPTGGASGDSYITLPQSIADLVISPPAPMVPGVSIIRASRF